MKDFSKFKRETAIEDEHDVQNELDRLFNLIQAYRDSSHYKNLLGFISRFKHLAPFNAMLVQIQRPHCRFVLTEVQWKRLWNRRIKPNARPVVILSFQPVSYLFDISDTESIDGFFSDDERLLEAIVRQYDTKQEVQKRDLDILVNNLSTLGIAYTDGFRAGADYAARIELLEHPIPITVPINKENDIKYHANYLISVNETLSTGARYASILHELGHLLCKHLIPPKDFDGWKVRPLLTHTDKEFEAESVAWIICERLNINNPSERYLAGYVQDVIPPLVSIDSIFKAHNEIWKLLFTQQYARNSFLYKHDPFFKNLIDRMK